MARPKSAPPSTSCVKRPATCATVAFSPPTAMPSSTTNSTTAKPSLRSDSPASFISSDFSTCTDLRIARTEIGSVGEMSAPNSRHQMSGTAWPSAAKIPHMARPAIAVETTTPRLARKPTAHLRLARSVRSTCSAPAKSRKESMPFSSAWSSWTLASTSCASCSELKPSLPSATTATEVASENSSNAIVAGRRMKRWLSQLNSAARTIRTAAALKKAMFFSGAGSVTECLSRSSYTKCLGRATDSGREVFDNGGVSPPSHSPPLPWGMAH